MTQGHLLRGFLFLSPGMHCANHNICIAPLQIIPLNWLGLNKNRRTRWVVEINSGFTSWHFRFFYVTHTVWLSSLQVHCHWDKMAPWFCSPRSTKRVDVHEDISWKLLLRLHGVVIQNSNFIQTLKMGMFSPEYHKMLEFFSFPIVPFFVNCIITLCIWKCQN